MDTLRSILVGVDFTPGSAAALRHAIRLARPSKDGSSGATVRALHVINTHVVVELQHALSPLQKNIQASLEAEVRRQWAAFEPDVQREQGGTGERGGRGIELTVRVGNAAGSIVDEAAAASVDMLVLGIHREAGEESGAGTVAGACVRKSPCPVLLVRADQPSSFRRVVACVDFSPISRRVIVEASRLARTENAALDILHVYEPPWKQLHYFAPMPENSPQFQEQHRAETLAKLRDLCAPFRAELDGLSHEYKLGEHQSAGRGIVEHARDTNADVIVVGTSGRTGIREFVLGSTAERLLRQSPCSMLTVKPIETK